MPSIRRLYLYLVALVSLLALMIGLISVSAEMIGLWLNSQPFRITPAELAASDVARWLAVVLISLPLWAIHWALANRTAHRLAMEGATERSAAARKAYFYDGQFGALIALVLLTSLFLYDVFLHALGQASTLPIALGGWPARPAALAAGALIAFLFWMYLQFEARRDGDVGHEPGAGAGWRRTYQYLAVLLGTTLVALGGAEFLRILLELAGGVFLTSSQAPDTGSWRELAAAGLAALLVGAPLAWNSWRRADWLAADDASGAEVNSLGRKLLVYVGLLAGVATTLLAAGFLVLLVCLLLLGQPVADMQTLWQQSLAPALAYLPVGLLLWAAFGRALRNDMNWAAESNDAAAFRRLYFYLVAGLTVAGFWYGAQQVLSHLVFLLLGLEPLAALQMPGTRTTFSLAAALFTIAGLVWWWHWARAQYWARQPGPAGHEERISLVRRVYLYGVVLAAGAVVIVTLGIVIYRAPAWLFGPHQQADFSAALVQLGVATALALVWWIGHGVVMRTDNRLIAEETGRAAGRAILPDFTIETGTDDAPGRGAAPYPAGAGSEQEDAESPGRRYGQYDRTQLPDLRSNAQAFVRPRAIDLNQGEHGTASAAVAVVDGGNGSIGQMLIAALRQTVPDVVLWPVGLNDMAQQSMDQALEQEEPAAVPVDALQRAVAILGPSDIVMPGGLGGEVPPELASAIVDSPARKVLLPPEDPRLRWVAAPEWPVERWMQQAVAEVADIVRGA